MISAEPLEHHLNTTPLHPRVKSVADCLERIRSSLHNTYADAERPLVAPIPFTVAENLYKEYHDIFDEILQLLKNDIKIAVSETSRDWLRVVLAQAESPVEGGQVGDARPAGEEGPQVWGDARALSLPEAKRQKTNDSDGRGRPLDIRAPVATELRRSRRLQDSPSPAPTAFGQ